MSHLYILENSKQQTKIGITENLDSRMSSYDTHNPDYKLMHKFILNTELAKEIESGVKNLFKHKLVSDKSKEWFNIPSIEVKNIVDTLLHNKQATTPIKPIKTVSMHGVDVDYEMTNEFDHLLSIIETLNKNWDTEALRDKYLEEKRNQQLKISSLFAKKFQLGIPSHEIKDLKNVLIIDQFNIDLNYANKDFVEQEDKLAYLQQLHLPYEDHVWHFYHLLPLDTGYYLAKPTAKVIMPYVSNKYLVQKTSEIMAKAKDFGLRCTSHHEWSWHQPEETVLYLLEYHTPIEKIKQEWDTSFRKFVIENCKVLESIPFNEKNKLNEAIQLIKTDESFPLNCNSYNELMDNYLSPVRKVFKSFSASYNELCAPIKELFKYWHNNKI